MTEHLVLVERGPSQTPFDRAPLGNLSPSHLLQNKTRKSPAYIIKQII